jgi:hypothetical protein
MWLTLYLIADKPPIAEIRTYASGSSLVRVAFSLVGLALTAGLLQPSDRGSANERLDAVVAAPSSHVCHL